jgi:hypothetical protein
MKMKFKISNTSATQAAKALLAKVPAKEISDLEVLPPTIGREFEKKNDLRFS